MSCAWYLQHAPISLSLSLYLYRKEMYFALVFAPPNMTMMYSVEYRYRCETSVPIPEHLFFAFRKIIIITIMHSYIISFFLSLTTLLLRRCCVDVHGTIVGIFVRVETMASLPSRTHYILIFVVFPCPRPKKKKTKAE